MQTLAFLAVARPTGVSGSGASKSQGRDALGPTPLGSGDDKINMPAATT